MKCLVKHCRRPAALVRRSWAGVCLLAVLVLQTACFGEKEPEPYYGQAARPQASELRWSAGGVPQIFDPARAAHAPDTDAVRALYEGLTEYNPKTLEAMPGVAQRWEVTADGREWTFYLRKNAKWSNGETVKAQDFARSWQRVQQLGAESPHYALLENIMGAKVEELAAPSGVKPTDEPPAPAPDATPSAVTPSPTPSPTPAVAPLGARAVSDFVLKVRLQNPAPNFPALVAHTVFRPVYQTAEFPTLATAEKALISNGPFRLARLRPEAATLERAATYWDVASVSLERVQMVAAKDAEAALALYREGAVDIVTNAGFAPLALKLLAPYKDFRRSTFSALNYYQFNPLRPPLDNVKVRQALALALDRERLVADVLAGANEPARRFLPGPNAAPALTRDVPRARALLREAGFPDGAGFPTISLLINRNEQQKQLARAVALMWRRALGVETEIVSKDWNDYQASLQAGDFAVARRSVVMPTTEATTNLWLLFAPLAKPETVVTEASPTPAATPDITATPAATPESAVAPTVAPTPFPIPQDEAEALRELPAVPVYFASTYALVKPYINGFDTNLLDAPALKQVRLDAAWQPPPPATNEWFGPTGANKLLP